MIEHLHTVACRCSPGSARRISNFLSGFPPAYKGRGCGVDRNTALSDANRWIGMIVHFSRSFEYTLKNPSTSFMLDSGEKWGAKQLFMGMNMVNG